MPRRPVELEAARLRAAMHARAGELGACVRPASALPLVPARIEVDRSGQVRDVAFEVKQPMPPAFEKCVRGRLLSWQVDGLELDGSLEVTVTFGLRDAG